jgi:hypothetical protein
MTEDTSFIKIKLTKALYGFSGIPFPPGTVLGARIGPYGKVEVEVVSSRYLPLRPDHWELVLGDEDLPQWMDDK